MCIIGGYSLIEKNNPNNVLLKEELPQKESVDDFILDVKILMDSAKISFVQISLRDANREVEFFSDSSGDGKLDEEDLSYKKDYSIGMDKYGNFTKVVVYNDSFCYEAEILVEQDNYSRFDKNNVAVNDVRKREKTDSFYGCNGKKIQ